MHECSDPLVSVVTLLLVSFPVCRILVIGLRLVLLPMELDTSYCGQCVLVVSIEESRFRSVQVRIRELCILVVV